ncbi:MAG: hypothetical protein KBT12_07185 [Bacteroidales bacterium]|nr:hypothetical protein [Candidatus Physcousia equi]
MADEVGCHEQECSLPALSEILTNGGTYTRSNNRQFMKGSETGCFHLRRMS